MIFMNEIAGSPVAWHLGRARFGIRIELIERNSSIDTVTRRGDSIEAL